MSLNGWPRAVLGLLLCAAATLKAGAADFVYQGPDCRIVYRFVPRTGTLNDLTIIYNDGFTFFPAYHGGITSFDLGGERLKPWAGRHAVEVLGEAADGPGYQAEFRWSHGGESFDFRVRIRREGKTLIVRTEAPQTAGNVVEFGADRTEATPDPKVVVLPYGHHVLWTKGIFLSAVLDPSVSRASSLWPLNAIFSDTSAYYSDLASYAPLTDGRRRSLNETLSLTVSPRIEDTFRSFSTAVSDHRESLSRRIIMDVWRASFSRTREALAGLAALGYRDLLVILHPWQKHGYDDGLPTTYPAGASFGGPEGLQAISDVCRTNGYGLALHTNYVDFYPDSEDWTVRDLALNPDGEWVKSWFNPSTGIQSYLMKPSRSSRYAGIYEPLIHEAYGTTAGYLDVHSAVLPSFKVDFDAGADGGGMQRSTYQSYLSLFDDVRSVHDGPLLGEGFGYSTALWAGHIDGLEADPRSIDDLLRDREGSDVPTLVDYKLRVLHHLFVPHGAGYLERFYRHPLPLTSERLERYRATELAFGNAGFLAEALVSDAPEAELRREYCFLKHIQAHYLNARPAEISYSLDGGLVDLSTALNRILPGVGNDGVADALRDGLARLRVRYDNGFVLCVNRSREASWEVAAASGSIPLPPSGFLGIRPGEFIAYTAVVQGRKSYFIWPVEPMCREAALAR